MDLHNVKIGALLFIVTGLLLDEYLAMLFIFTAIIVGLITGVLISVIAKPKRFSDAIKLGALSGLAGGLGLGLISTFATILRIGTPTILLGTFTVLGGIFAMIGAIIYKFVFKKK